MPAPRKYPFGELAIGDTTHVGDVPSRATITTALQHWREAVIRDGLATREHAPQFSIAYDPVDRIAGITRLQDGPIRRGRHKLLDVALATPMAAEEARIRRWIADVHRPAHEAAAWAGEPAPMAPLDIVEAARRVSPELAQEIADMDCGQGGRLPRDLRLDVETAEQVMREPHNGHPLRRHDDRPDQPHDRHLAYRLAHIRPLQP